MSETMKPSKPFSGICKVDTKSGSKKRKKMPDRFVEFAQQQSSTEVIISQTTLSLYLSFIKCLQPVIIMAVAVSSGSDDYDSSKGKHSASSSHKIMLDPESIRLYLGSMSARVLSRVSMETLRPLPIFLGVNPVGLCLLAGAFTPPVKNVDKASPEKIQSRLRLNFAFFLSNYFLLAAIVAVVVALMHPGMLLFLGIVWALWGAHSYLIRNEFILFGVHVHSLLTVQQRFYVLFVITTVVVVWKCLVPTLIFAVISSLLILSHAFLRDPKHIEQSSSAMLGAVDSDDDEGTGSGGSNESEVLVEKPRSEVI
jgi:hypothetical protein